MAYKVKVVITNDQKSVKVPKGLRMLIRRCCTAVLVMEEFKGDAEVSVRIVDNEKIRELNKTYRNIDASTDVLSFPLGVDGKYDVNLSTGEAELGDIVLSLETAMEQAERYGHSLDREVGYLTVHSMLHLLGYDHENGGLELVRMREKEEKALAELGLSRNGNYYMEDERV
ncbi:MAG: rRNA maturation RNase YbeY [Clostridia bacterium]|jgi:probable rRNA maturation factor|nr:rRNA maturation RNase YbeY [Clostridia bacterium]